MNAFVEFPVLVPQRAVQDVNVGQGSGNIEEAVKEPLFDRPHLSEQIPKGFESSKKALHKHPSGAELCVFLTTHNNTREVPSRADVSDVGENLALPEDILEVLNVRTEHQDVVHRSGKRLGNERGGSRSDVVEDFLFERVEVVFAREEDLRHHEWLLRPPRLTNSAINDQLGWGDVGMLFVAKTNETVDKVCSELLGEPLRQLEDLFAFLMNFATSISIDLTPFAI